MKRFVLLTIAGLICISTDMKSHATTTIGWATSFNEAVFPTTESYVTSNSSIKFNRLNRVKAKWSGNDVWEAQARHASNYTLSAYSTTSTTPPKYTQASYSTTKHGKGSAHSHYHVSKQKHPIRRIPAKVKKSGHLHRRTRPISKKKGSTSTTASSTTTTKTMTTPMSPMSSSTTTTNPKTSAMNAKPTINLKAAINIKAASINPKTSTTTTTTTSTTSPSSTTTTTTTTTTTARPEQTGNSYKANGYGLTNVNAKAKGTMGMPLPSANKHKRKPLRPVIKITVTNRPNKTPMTTLSTTTALSSSSSSSSLKPTKTLTTTKSTPAPIVKLPSHLTKRPILPSRTTSSTPTPVHLSTTTQKYYPKTSNTLLSLISASTTPAVTIPNTPFLFMEENSFLTRLSISLFYSSIAIAPVIFSLFSGLAASKRKRKKREDPSFYNYLNGTAANYNSSHSIRGGGAGGDDDEIEEDETRYKSLAHFPKSVVEKLKEIESSLPSMTNAR